MQDQSHLVAAQQQFATGLNQTAPQWINSKQTTWPGATSSTNRPLHIRRQSSRHLSQVPEQPAVRYAPLDFQDTAGADEFMADSFFEQAFDQSGDMFAETGMRMQMQMQMQMHF